MITIPGRIPIMIHPFFWVMAGIIGWLIGRSVIGMIIWMAIILVSVLVHELGHALTASFFGKSPKIQLVALGGATSYDNKNLKFWKQFCIVLNGPVFGFLLFLIPQGIIWLKIIQNPFAIQLLQMVATINLFWTVVNLLPVMPLDGGQLLRIALEGFFGLKGFKISLFIGMIVAFGISLTFFLFHGFLIGAIFFLFAFQGFEMWRQSRNLTTEDRKEEHAEKMRLAEIAFMEKHFDEAKKLLEEVYHKTKCGMLHASASHFLALINFEQGNHHEAYILLLDAKDKLPIESKCLLHKLAFEEKNYSLVTELSAPCYQIDSTFDVAYANARAFAYLKQSKPAGGWLHTALNFDKINLQTALNDKAFDSVKIDPVFMSFFEKRGL